MLPLPKPKRKDLRRWRPQLLCSLLPNSPSKLRPRTSSSGRREPGLVGVGARHDEGVVHVLVDDLTLYDTLLEEFQLDPEVVVTFSEEAVVYLPIGAISPNSPSD